MNEIASIHHADLAWAAVTNQIRTEMALRQVHPAHTVVLVPYAQLMQAAKSAWLKGAPGAQFVPRFETTLNWTRALGGFEPTGDDIRQDAALDVLTAADLLVRAGLKDHQSVLAPRLMEAAWSLAKVAAAVPPEERLAWGGRLGAGLANVAVLGMEAPALALEVTVARIALAWAASSGYATDVLFEAQPGLLVVIEGFLTEPLAMTLRQRMGDRGLGISLKIDGSDPPRPPQLHPALDAEDEAQAAAACVLAHLNEGRSPVALVAVDRLLTRRVRAMLAERGIQVRDETGWKLSTTRAAASLMGLLRACVWDASSDAVLDWLKNTPAFSPSAVTALEIELRRIGVRDWRGLKTRPNASEPTEPISATQQLAAEANALRDTLARSRPLAQWLRDVRLALRAAGQWEGLLGDAAGQEVLQALRLIEGAEDEVASFTARLSLSEFTTWVSQALEAGSFMPTHPAQAQVVILPLSQLLGRSLPAVVVPGCDEVRLATSSEPPGDWTPQQRELLGLASRDELDQALRQSWLYALQFLQIDLLWRGSEGGERLMPSGFVQELLLQTPLAVNQEGGQVADPRVFRALTPQPCTQPAPSGEAFPVKRLSSSAYEDLRRCPYRFFALRQLRLQESDELESELGKREFGNWLHQVLHRFHEALKAALEEKKVPEVPFDIDKLAMINIAAEEATADLGLSQSEFLPFAAAWPQVRSGYLQWLAEHEATGATYAEGEAWKEMPLGALKLVGKIDRIDHMADGTPWVMDYKTEARALTAERIKPDAQDTQIAFYGALLSHDTLAGAYINVGEREPTKTYTQPDIVHQRDQLIEGIVDDMSRIAEGAGLRAMGEGKACEFCAARGLCRKDFWS